MVRNKKMYQKERILSANGTDKENGIRKDDG